MAQYKLNFPIVTPEAYAFWESRHKLNRIKAIISFSLDLDNANDNLRRAGYYRQYRKRYLQLYASLVHKPDMKGVPLSDLTEYWWDPKPLTITWVTRPPINATINTNYTATWSGGTAPYKTDIIGPVNLNPTDVSGPPLQLTMNVDGTNQPAGDYVWTIEDANGDKITATTHVFAPGPHITRQPADATVKAPTPFSLSVVASGSGTLQYKWFETTSGTEAPITSHDNQTSWTSGATSAASSPRKFIVKITDNNGTITSREAVITITA